MKYPLVLIVLLCLGMASASAQALLPCGSEDEHANLILHSSHYQAHQKHYEENYRRYLQQNESTSRNGAPYVLPVVVHVVHDCTPIGNKGNPTNAEIKRVLDGTSQRFRHQHRNAQSYSNPYYGIDTEIEFCLAQRDPEGNYTTGIVRHADAQYNRGLSSSQSIFFSQNYSWDPTRYINIFLVEDTDVAGVYVGGSDKDFIIINTASFWDGLMAHELGHYFSLLHVFSPNGEGTCTNNRDCLIEGDYVCDTPPKHKSGIINGSCETPGNSCVSDENDTSQNNPYRAKELGGMGDQPDMLSNYMDYTGNCWDAFTEGQKRRMHFNIEVQRIGLVNNAPLICAPFPPELDISLEQVELLQKDCSDDWIPQILVHNNGTQSVNSLTVNLTINQNEPLTFQPAVFLAPGDTTLLSLSALKLPVGKSAVAVSIAAPNGAADAYSNNSQYCLNVESTGVSGLTAAYEATFTNCQFPEALRINNSNNVAWETGESSNELRECHPCFASVQAFSETTETAELCLPNMDLRTFPEASLKFTFGYIPRYDFITNTLEVFVTAECGVQSKVYSAAGLELATNSPPAYSGGEFKVPSCEDIKTVEIDLSEYLGKSNVEICFLANGRWFSPLILDDIIIQPEEARQQQEETSVENPPTIEDDISLEEETQSNNQESNNNNCQTITYEQAISTCEGQAIEGYLGPGIYQDTFKMENGCDSIRVLTLTVAAERIITHIEERICEGSSFEGYRSKGSYIDLFTSSSGCDSIRVLDLYILENPEVTQYAVICQGADFQGYTETGTYVDTHISVSGCDSVSVTNLTVEPCNTTTNTFEITAPTLLSLYPNPASAQVTIRWLGEETLYYSIFSLTGKAMVGKQLLTKDQLVPLSQFESGLYLVQFESEKGHFVKKLMIH